jgi:predicted permease
MLREGEAAIARGLPAAPACVAMYAGSRMVSTFLRDVRFGWRLLVRSPGFTFTAATLLAIGIAANTLVFSAVDALLLRPLPVKNPENLVRLVEVHPNDFLTWDLPYRFCDDVAARATSLSGVLCQAEADMALTDGASTERVRVHLVSANFFSSLGVDAVLGRVLTGEDARAGSASAVLSYNFWRRRFAKDRGVLGRTMVLGGRAFTVIGVSAERFNGLTVDTSPDLRVPLAAGGPLLDTESAENPTGRNLFAQIFGRLRPGVTLERANREVDPQLEPAYDQEIDRIFPQARGAGSPGPVNRSKLRLESVSRGVSALRAPFTHGLEAAMAGVGLLLMMACANVAGLLLARSSMRAPEIGIRLALGAHPCRVVRQLLTEGVLLAVTGGAAGLLLTWLGAPLLTRALPAVRDRGAVLQPKAVHIEIDCASWGLPLPLRCSRLCCLRSRRHSAPPVRTWPGRSEAAAAPHDLTWRETSSSPPRWHCAR